MLALTTYLSALAGLAIATDVQVTLSNSEPFKTDSNGAGPLDVAFGPIFELNGTYRWIGASQTYALCADNQPPGVCGLRSYQSTDLMTWNDEGIFADVADPQFKDFLGPNWLGLGRPHIIYNGMTQSYVLWANTEGAFTTWTAPAPLGPYTLKGPVSRPQNVIFAGDFTVRNVSGSGWISYSAFNFSAAGTIWPPFNQVQILQELTEDYTNFTGTQYGITSSADDEVDRSTEAADLFERNGYVYWTGSATCGNCNDGILITYRTKDIRSNVWTRQIISGDTCGGQTEGVLVASNDAGEKTYIHSADLWRGDGTLRLHGKNVQPLYFNDDGSFQDLDCSPNRTFSFTVSKGAGPDSSGKSPSFTDGSDPNQLYTYTCDLYEYNFYQTWQSSKGGMLKEVGVNLGALNTTTPIQLGIYNFTSNSDFLTPSAHFLNLYNETFGWSDVPVGAGLVTIKPNVTVTEGENLVLFVTGINNPFGGPSAAGDYCYLNKAADEEFEESSSTRVLFRNLIGDVSPKGINGDESPIRVTGRELTWYAIVE